VLTDQGSPIGLTMDDLIEVGLRRNPRRAQLLVSAVLGKHLAVDPRVAAGMGRLLGALVARVLGVTPGPVPSIWASAARQTVSGADPGALLRVLEAERSAPDTADVTLGFAETATALGHLVADQLGSSYLHSTRRRDGAVPVAAEFAEPHSHAIGHLLRPGSAALLDGAGPVVLVDDELSTGRTALNVIEVLHAISPRSRYVLAGLVDVRSPQDDRARAAAAERLGCRIDVVSLVRGGIDVPEKTVERVAAELEQDAPVPRHRRVEPPTVVPVTWPVDVPDGGRHGFADPDRPAFDAAVARAGEMLSEACGSANRILLLGTEELMYLPLRLALELARNPLRQMKFQSTTRSPVHAIDRPGYPIRRRIDFRSATIGAETLDERHIYNAFWPPSPVETGYREADLIVFVDDGHAVSGTGGLADGLILATGVPVLHAVLTPGRPR
jgi:adenine/guanine phosphoribosyltransferase-like PRPP-binding protein